MVTRPPEPGETPHHADEWPHRGSVVPRDAGRPPWQVTVAVVLPILPQVLNFVLRFAEPGADTGPALLWGFIFGFLAYKAFRGRNWARVTITVLSCLGILIAVGVNVLVTRRTGVAPGWEAILAVVPWLVTIVLLWQRASTRFFQAHG